MLTQEQLSAMSKEERLLTILNDQDLWPNWPWLPVKIGSLNDVDNMRTGMVCPNGDKFYIWTDAVMFFPMDVWKGKKEATAEEIVAEGWEVD